MGDRQPRPHLLQTMDLLVLLSGGIDTRGISNDIYNFAVKKRRSKRIVATAPVASVVWRSATSAVSVLQCSAKDMCRIRPSKEPIPFA